MSDFGFTLISHGVFAISGQNPLENEGEAVYYSCVVDFYTFPNVTQAGKNRFAPYSFQAAVIDPPENGIWEVQPGMQGIKSFLLKYLPSDIDLCRLIQGGAFTVRPGQRTLKISGEEDSYINLNRNGGMTCSIVNAIYLIS